MSKSKNARQQRRKKAKRARDFVNNPVLGEDFDVCIVCETALSLPGGYAGTGMCGPCCTGEAATLEEFGETW